jgi:GNAT superfamily N-acetyltransferase
VTGATRVATQDDVPSWLELIPEAERLFGPMPTFETHLLRAIDRGTALVVADQAKVVGGVLLSRDGQPHQIYWLYVRRSRRREGVGIALLEAVLERWPTGNVEVATFTADSPGGQPARALYERFGFVCCGRTHPAPDGGPRDSFLLRR